MFPLVPLAQAARNAGHEVLFGATENVMPLVSGAGLPGVPLTSKTMKDFMFVDHNGNQMGIPPDPHERNLFNGRGMARLAIGSLEGLIPLVETWRPDVIVGGKLSYAAPLVAGKYDLPYVRHALNLGEPPIIDLSAAAELSPLVERMGLVGLPDAEMFVDTCPPSVRRFDAGPAQFMRYVPFNTQRPVEPWMLSKGDRPRLFVSAGSRVTRDYEFDTVAQLVQKVSPMDVELLLAAPDDIVDALGPLPDNVRAGWLPLDVLVRTCDLLVHHAGGNTMLTGMVAGVPQLLIPQMPKQVGPAERLAEHGSAITLRGGEDTAEVIAESARALLEDGSYRERAAAMSEEIAGLPAPADVVGEIERRFAGRS